MNTYVEPIEVNDIVLTFGEDVRDDGSRVAILINRATDEIREQLVGPLPQGPRWRATVEARMRRIGWNAMIPYTLLRGVR